MGKTETSKKGRAKRRRKGLVIAFAAAVTILCVDYFAYPWGVAIGAPSADKSRNGLWIRYTHYFGEVSDEKVDVLAVRLRDGGFKFAYFHVRFVKKDGTLAYRYPDGAQNLLERVRAKSPDTAMMAWVFAGNERASGEVDLSSSEVRANMVREAVWLVEECGFDGVQWDYEMCADGDQDFLALLEETRKDLPSEATIGACAPVIYPGPLNLGWSDDYIMEVARRCDQVAVMCYDTGFVIPRGYVWLTRQQVRRYADAVKEGNRNATYLIGVPTYGPGYRSHNPRAENLSNALRAVRQGFQQADMPKNFDGIAIFADYTTDETEWNLFADNWRTR